MSKKIKMIILIVVVCIITGIVGTIIFLKGKEKEPIFKYSYENHTWEDSKNGYIIYFNGDIEEYDEYAKPEDLKKAKLSKDEIKQLKELANKVEDEYQEYDIEISGAGLGKSVDEVYSKRLKKWITLSKMEDDGSGGGNLSETGESILDLTSTVYEKYIENETNQ